MSGYAVVDVEATGRSPWRHRVVEVAVVQLDAGLRTEREFATLVDPGGPVGPTHVHGIAQADVLGAPRFRQIAPRLLELLAGRVLVGHHVTCDRAFLEREFARIGVALPQVPLLCTMRLARRQLPEAGGYGLSACVDAAGLGWFPAHTALGDARATVELLRHCRRTGGCSEEPPPERSVEQPAGQPPVPWPRLAPARAARAGGAAPLLRRVAQLGPWPAGVEGPRALIGSAGYE
ncbi:MULTISPECIES: 3'-5' exonuclease [Kitasatospora]|uniref:Putative exonuclease n=1 Tax=Kitasatospora setae (strain ATCC 33774 / DSM 43861 / JCM 3304 / KCC A-0304 / NBRC 14216 / KM-6054) TaxID=452652 RepID=E4ND93_KITSK|nr:MULTISPECIES: 3'-5' exonuclease [Kitasatospora]BAJ29174.1 putative exonuclease [Kitasatospora setae KM-6054]